MKISKLKIITILALTLEAIFATLAVATIFEEGQPILATLFMAAAKGTAVIGNQLKEIESDSNN